MTSVKIFYFLEMYSVIEMHSFNDSLSDQNSWKCYISNGAPVFQILQIVLSVILLRVRFGLRVKAMVKVQRNSNHNQ